MTISKGLNRLPLLIAMPYLLFTYALFFIGPFEWPVRAWWVIYLYVPLVFVALIAGFALGSRSDPHGTDLLPARAFYWIGACAALLLLVPSAYTYTGKAPWAISGALADQKEAYSALAQQLADTEGTRGPLAMARGLCGPFVFCVLPLLVITWKNSSAFWKTAGIFTVLASVDLSILRGTTRELADIMVVATSAFLIRAAIKADLEGRNVTHAIYANWKQIAVALVALSITLTSVVGRTQVRLGGQKIGCLSQSGVCADLNAGVYRGMSDTFAFGTAAVTGYLSQGYYGLSLAGEKPFMPTWGLGHSPPLAAWTVKVGGDPTFTQRTYTNRGTADGWSDQTQWSTLMAWIANDLGFAGTLGFILLLGILWGKSWIDAVRGRDIRAAVFFCALMMMIFYLPANNQMMSTLENYMALIFWGVLWLTGRKRRPIVAA